MLWLTGETGLQILILEPYLNRPSRLCTVQGTDRIIRTVNVTNALPGWSFSTPTGHATSASLLESIVSYGGLSLANTESQFKGCTSLLSFPATGPSLALPFNCALMFTGCTGLTGTGINTLNTSNVNNMTEMFKGCEVFNGNLLNWNVSNVTLMNGMFNGCNAFTGVDIFGIPEDDKVRNMAGMFLNCTHFDGNLSAWNVQNVTTMASMFLGCTAFTGGDANATRIFGILEDNKVRDMNRMFEGCIHFNGNLSNWNVKNVVTMQRMFFGCTAFTGVDEQGGPGIFGITETNINFGFVRFDHLMNNMFEGCTHFNGDISDWNVQTVKNMSGIFTGCVNFRRNLSNWRMTSIQNNESAPTFTNAYIAEVNPAFSTGNTDAWKFTAPVNADVLNVIVPENINLYYIDLNLRLRRATDDGRISKKSRFSQSVIMPSYKTVIMKSYI